MTILLIESYNIILSPGKKFPAGTNELTNYLTDRKSCKFLINQALSVRNHGLQVQAQLDYLILIINLLQTQGFS